MLGYGNRKKMLFINIIKMKRILFLKNNKSIWNNFARMQKPITQSARFQNFNGNIGLHAIRSFSDRKEGWSPVASDESEAATIAQTKEFMKVAKQDSDNPI